MCATSSVLCLKCENKQLRQYIVELQKKLMMYEEAERTDHSVDVADRLEIFQYIKQSDKPPILTDYLPTPYEKWKFTRFPNQKTEQHYNIYLQQFRFITMTFDPSKWGLQQKESIRKDNILYQLSQELKNRTIINLFGCFEYHKNGILHAHAIFTVNTTTANESELYKRLKSVLTDNTRNKIAFQQGPAKFPQSVEYITKESNEYFYSQSANTINPPRLTASA